MENILKLVGSKIRDFRKIRGLTQDQLGEICGFHYSYIGGVERGERNVSLENLAKISTALNVEPAVFFQFDNPFIAEIPEDKERAIEELLSFLKTKDIKHIKMTTNILYEIFKSFKN